MSSKILNVIMVGVLLLPTMFVGCSDETSTGTNSDYSEQVLKEEATGKSIGKLFLNLEVLLFSTELPNEITVSVSGAYVIGDSIHVHYSYVSATGGIRTRLLKMHVSLLAMAFYDENEYYMGGHEFTVDDENDFTFRIWSGNDLFVMSASVSDESLAFSTSNGQFSTSVSFAGKEEFDYAVALSHKYPPTTDRTDLTDYELSLLTLNETWAGAIREYGSFAIGNEDLETVEYLMADEGFLEFIFVEFPENIPGPLGISKLCGAAGIGSFACGFLWWCAPCWIPCVPIVGVGLACAIAALFG